MTDPAVTPFAAAELARAKLKAREDAIRANAIKQGREAERKAMELQTERTAAMHAGHIAGLKEAQSEELSRLAKLVAPKSLYKGLMIGLAASIFTGVMGILGGYWLFERGVTTQVASQRIPRSDVPNLTDSYVDLEPATGEPIRRAP